MSKNWITVKNVLKLQARTRTHDKYLFPIGPGFNFLIFHTSRAVAEWFKSRSGDVRSYVKCQFEHQLQLPISDTFLEDSFPLTSALHVVKCKTIEKESFNLRTLIIYSFLHVYLPNVIKNHKPVCILDELLFANINDILIHEIVHNDEKNQTTYKRLETKPLVYNHKTDFIK